MRDAARRFAVGLAGGAGAARGSLAAGICSDIADHTHQRSAASQWRRARRALGEQPAGNGLVYDAAFLAQLQAAHAHIAAWSSGGAASEPQLATAQRVLRQLASLQERCVDWLPVGRMPSHKWQPSLPAQTSTTSTAVQQVGEHPATACVHAAGPSAMQLPIVAARKMQEQGRVPDASVGAIVIGHVP
jgi:hypothetical protein